MGDESDEVLLRFFATTLGWDAPPLQPPWVVFMHGMTPKERAQIIWTDYHLPVLVRQPWTGRILYAMIRDFVAHHRKEGCSNADIIAGLIHAAGYHTAQGECGDFMQFYRGRDHTSMSIWLDLVMHHQPRVVSYSAVGTGDALLYSQPVDCFWKHWLRHCCLSVRP